MSLTETVSPARTAGPRKWAAPFRLLFTGLAMGSADIVPGVSGGTIAFISGIYEQLLQGIKTVTSVTPRLLLQRRPRQALASVPFAFFLPLGTGILVAGFSLANLISWLLKNQPVYVWAFFLGLVGASVLLVLRRVRRWSRLGLVFFVLSLAAAYLMTSATAVETPATPLAFFLSGALAICAMILPGISGSFLLVILGKYEQVLDAVAQRDIITLLPLFLGALVGIALFSRLLTFLLARYHDLVVLALAGLMLGSLPRIWPWKDTSGYVPAGQEELALSQLSQQPNVLPDSLGIETVGAVLLILLGAALILVIDRLGQTRRIGPP